MQGRDAVHRMAADNGQVGHAYHFMVALFNDRKVTKYGTVSGIQGLHLFKETPVDLIDDLDVPRQHKLDQFQRPFFKGLGKDGVVGVGKGLDRDFPGLVPAQGLVIHKQAHQLRNGKGRVRIIKLDRDHIGKLINSITGLFIPADDVLQCRGHEKILLLEAQFLAGDDIVIGVQYTRDVLGKGPVGDGPYVVAVVEIFQVKFAGRFRRPQPQVVHGIIAVPGDRGVIGHGHDLMRVDPPEPLPSLLVMVVFNPAVKIYRIQVFRPGKLPDVSPPEPVVRALNLVAVAYGLEKYAVFITQPVSSCRELKGRH